MRRGTISSQQRLEHVLAIEDVNLKGDGALYTIYILSEGITRSGRISPKAKLVNAVRQRAAVPHIRVDVPDALVKKALEWIK